MITVERQALSWHCPSCGRCVTGFKNDSGEVKVECSECHIVMVRQDISRRLYRIRIYAPTKETEEFISQKGPDETKISHSISLGNIKN